MYKPRKEVKLLSSRKAEMIAINTALRLRATMDFTDRYGIQRVFGEEWLVKEHGSYMIGANEEKVAVVKAHFLDENVSIFIGCVLLNGVAVYDLTLDFFSMLYMFVHLIRTLTIWVNQDDMVKNGLSPIRTQKVIFPL